MPRSLWNGTISVGLINVPVKLYTAVESKTVHFREVHLEDEGKVQHRRFCSAEDKEVPYEEVVKGYEVSRGKYVVLDKDEIAAAAGDRAHALEVEAFVETDAIDPVFYEKTYYLGAGAKGGDATRWSGPAGRASAASRSTTASTSPRSARSTACWPCTRCGSRTRSWPGRTSSSTRPAGDPATGRSRWPASSSRPCTRSGIRASARTSTARRCSR